MSEGDFRVFWDEVIKQIQSEIDEGEFAFWFSNLEYIRGTGNELFISVPSEFFKEQFIPQYRSNIEDKIKDLTGRNLTLVLEIKPRTERNRSSTAPDREEQPKQAPDQGSLAPKNVPQEAKKPPHAQLRDDFTFDRYVIGDNNKFAGMAAIATAKNPGTSYNPLLIYGGVGLGKTHLMQSIGNYIHVNSRCKIIYITAENFTNEFIHSLEVKGMTAFKNKYRNVDVLLVDDIHFLQNKWETQEELFHTFNTLYDSKKQIVFTCDRPASELKNINERLINRFSRGINLDIQPPDYETRCAILKNKITAKNISISDEVISFIAQNISTNVRDLEAALTKLIAYGDLVNKSITLDIARQQLRDNITDPKQANISIDIIQRVVADEFHISINDLKGKKRAKNIAAARHIAQYLAYHITGYSTTEVGEYFGGRDHTTVMHSRDKIQQQILNDANFDVTIKNLERKIRESAIKS